MGSLEPQQKVPKLLLSTDSVSSAHYSIAPTNIVVTSHKQLLGTDRHINQIGVSVGTKLT